MGIKHLQLLTFHQKKTTNGNGHVSTCEERYKILTVQHTLCELNE